MDNFRKRSVFAENNFWVAVLIICIFSVVMLFIPVSCTDKAGTERVLRQQGYKDIQVGGYGWFRGSSGDSYITEFKAKAPNGEEVSGVVTSGLLKGNTVRID